MHAGAEKSLLDSLDKSRQSQKKQNVTISKDLTQFRSTLKMPSVDEISLAEVTALSHQTGELKVPRSKYENIKQNEYSKRERHDMEFKKYHGQVKRIGDDLEAHVLTLSDELKIRLEQIEKRRKGIFDKLENDAFMVKQEFKYAEEEWENLKMVCEDRTACLVEFKEQLDNIEVKRAEMVSTRLKELTRFIVENAFVLPDEAERLIETEAYELNVVLIANKRSYAELFANMKILNIDNFVRTRTKWERTVVHWRQIRHDREIENFTRDIASDTYTQPEEREQIFENIKVEQLHRHEQKRLLYLQQLADVRPSKSFDSDSVEAIINRFKVLHTEEEGRNEYYFEQLQNCNALKAEQANELREHTRRQLHEYAAKANEGNFRNGSEALRKMLQDERYTEFFRVSGSLKSELMHISTKIVCPNLIYQPEIDAILPRVQLIVDASTLKRDLKIAEKLAERKNLLDTLELLRKASKSSIPSIISTLQEQISLLSGVEGIHEEVLAELENINLAFSEVLEAADAACTLHTNDEADGTASISGKTVAASIANTELSRSSSKATTMRRQVATAANMLDMQTLKNVQRRLGLILYATDLNADDKTTIEGVLEELKVQRKANHVIDTIIENLCTDPINQRVREANFLTDEVGKNLEAKSTELNTICERICSYYVKIVSLHENYAAKCARSALDSQLLHCDLEDDYAAEDEERENLYLKHQASLRHAPDHEVLEAEFTNCQDALNQIERGYRTCFEKGVVASNSYPIVVEFNENLFLQQLCEIFGLKSPHTGPVDEEQANLLLLKSTIDQKVNPSIQNENEQEEELSTAVSDAPATTTDKHVKAKSKQKDSTAETFESSDGKVYEIVQTLETIAREMTNQIEAVDESVEHEAELMLDEPLVNDIPGTVDNEDDEQQPEEDPYLAEKEHAAKLADKYNVQTTVSDTKLLVMMKLLLHETIGEQGATRKSKIDLSLDEASQKVSNFTLELEDRLRQHWPRKGRLDVLIYQPREGELIAHKQRCDRQIRAILQKLEKQEKEFELQLTVASDFTKQYGVNQRALNVQLPMQNSLAMLQGIEKKGKQAFADYKLGMEMHVSQAMQFVHTEPKILEHLCTELIVQCKAQIFPDLDSCDIITGCDYHPNEISILESFLQDIRDKVAAAVEQRESKICALKEKQDEAAQAFQQFKIRYDSCLQDLSMREGLGQKFGCPRRNAQEQLRSEMARSDEAKSEIEKNLSSLQQLVNESTHGSTFRLIRHTLLALRQQLRNRATYLSYWKSDDFTGPEQTTIRPDHATVYILTDNQSRPNDMVCNDSEPEEPLWASPFQKAYKSIEERCKTDTRDLFKREGKESELPPNNGIPESLENYLADQLQRAEEYRLREGKVLYEQSNRLLALVQPLTKIAFESLSLLFFSKSRDECVIHANTFKAQCVTWDAQKNKHHERLKPDLCNANNKKALEELCTAETHRCAEVQASIPVIKEKLLFIQKSHAAQFEMDIVQMYHAFMEILNSIVMPEDLYSDQDPNQDGSKRKSLKRLRKALRRAEDGDPNLVSPRSGKAERFPKRKWPPIPDYGVLQLSYGEALNDSEYVAPTDSGDCVAYATSVHRNTVRARDEVFKNFVQKHQRQIEKSTNEYNTILANELQWQKNWEQQITLLQSEL